MGALIRLAVVGVILAAAWWLRGDFGDVLGALGGAGWSAVAAITLWHLLPVSLCGLACARLVPTASPLIFIAARWLRDGVGELAGFLPLAGEMAGARLLSRRGLGPALAGAATVVDLTNEVAAQVLFSLIGVGLWLWRYPESQIAHWGLIGLGVSLPVLGGFILAQRSVLMRFLETLPARMMPQTWRAPEAESGILAGIQAMHGQPRRLLAGTALHLVAWLVACGEAWLVLLLLGHPVAPADAVALESVIYAIRGAAFVVPGALGVQEGTYLLVGAALGLPAEIALAVSLLKRGREVVLGVPALLAWHWLDGEKAVEVEEG